MAPGRSGPSVDSLVRDPQERTDAVSEVELRAHHHVSTVGESSSDDCIDVRSMSTIGHVDEERADAVLDDCLDDVDRPVDRSIVLAEFFSKPGQLVGNGRRGLPASLVERGEPEPFDGPARS